MIVYFILRYDPISASNGYYLIPYTNFNLRVEFNNYGVSINYGNIDDPLTQRFLITNDGNNFVFTNKKYNKMLAIIDDYEYFEDDSCSDGYYVNVKKLGQSEYTYNSIWSIDCVCSINDNEGVSYNLCEYSSVNILNLSSFVLNSESSTKFAYNQDTWKHVISEVIKKYGTYGFTEIRYSVLKLEDEYNDDLSKDKYLILQEIVTMLYDNYSLGYDGLEWKNGVSSLFAQYDFKKAYLNKKTKFYCNIKKYSDTQEMLDHNLWADSAPKVIYSNGTSVDVSYTGSIGNSTEAELGKDGSIGGLSIGRENGGAFTFGFSRNYESSFETDNKDVNDRSYYNVYEYWYEYATCLDLSKLKKGNSNTSEAAVYSFYNSHSMKEFGFILVGQDKGKSLMLDLEFSTMHRCYDYDYLNSITDDEINIVAKVIC